MNNNKSDGSESTKKINLSLSNNYNETAECHNILTSLRYRAEKIKKVTEGGRDSINDDLHLQSLHLNNDFLNFSNRLLSSWSRITISSKFGSDYITSHQNAEERKKNQSIMSNNVSKNKANDSVTPPPPINRIVSTHTSPYDEDNTQSPVSVPFPDNESKPNSFDNNHTISPNRKGNMPNDRKQSKWSPIKFLKRKK